jgi:hypothetical protein
MLRLEGQAGGTEGSARRCEHLFGTLDLSDIAGSVEQTLSANPGADSRPMRKRKLSPAAISPFFTFG